MEYHRWLCLAINVHQSGPSKNCNYESHVFRNNCGNRSLLNKKTVRTADNKTEKNEKCSKLNGKFSELIWNARCFGIYLVIRLTQICTKQESSEVQYRKNE